MKILIATPAFQHQVNNEMVQSLLRAVEYLRQHNHTVNWFSPTSSQLAFNRNRACDIALNEHYDWLLFWDADISVDEPDFIEKMTELGHKTTADIVGLPVVLKGEPRTYNYSVNKNDEGYLSARALFDTSVECLVIGTGVMLIWVNLLKKMNPPYFTFTETYNGQAGCWPEDWNFCEKASEHTKIYVDSRFHVKHWGIKAYE